jgi:5-(carboxyamino)imidazole ribonucleotide synthase
MMRTIQDRILQKTWLVEHGFPVGDCRAILTEADLQNAVPALGGRCFLKSARGGYDGRSQVKIGFSATAGTEIYDAWRLLGEQPAIAEKALDLEKEISVMVARTPSGEVKSYPAATNHHEHQILAWSVIPSLIPASLETSAQEIAKRIAEEMQLEGVLAVEMFITRDGLLLVNELAPRPHNSYHASERACVISQFEQTVRAVCDLPLGDVSVITPAAIANLLGDLWQDHEPRFDRALAVPGVRLHLYEKHLPRAGRKMGHLSATAATPEEAVARVLEAKELL